MTSLLFDDRLSRIASALRLLADRVSYKDGWEFEVVSRFGAPVLLVRLVTIESESGVPGELIHSIPVPLGLDADDERGLWRWLFDWVVRIETHEAMEFFRVDGAAPYFPEHGSGRAYDLIERDVPVEVGRPPQSIRETLIRQRYARQIQVAEPRSAPYLPVGPVAGGSV